MMRAIMLLKTLNPRKEELLNDDQKWEKMMLQIFCHKYFDANIFDAGNNAAEDPDSTEVGTRQACFI